MGAAFAAALGQLTARAVGLWLSMGFSAGTVLATIASVASRRE
jgi:hypothetical protein